MLDYIYRLMRDFEQEHGFNPNLLYLNECHSEHIKLSFDETFTLQRIVEILGMDIVIDKEIIHPRVAWTHYAYRLAS
ncbi:hypothetical protein MNBD_GAMMA23-2449 [hydrothermal vent metagenome]|uniref:Uncharacterized protein n=1 Tax=hydrothermal vent metagenome TaxID=652676 RepID=A0A3B1AFG5_9ZZZZ